MIMMGKWRASDKKSIIYFKVSNILYSQLHQAYKDKATFLSIKIRQLQLNVDYLISLLSCRGHDHMIVGFTITLAISAYCN